MLTSSASAVQQKDVPQNASSTAGQASSSSPLMTGDVQIPTVSADVAADIAKYTNKVDYALPSLCSLDPYRTLPNTHFFCADHGDDQRDNDGNLQRPFQEHHGKHNCRGKFWSVCKCRSSFHTEYLTLALLMPQIRRLRIEIEKLQWLHQQELSEMKHNLGRFTES